MNKPLLKLKVRRTEIAYEATTSAASTLDLPIHVVHTGTRTLTAHVYLRRNSSVALVIYHSNVATGFVDTKCPPNRLHSLSFSLHQLSSQHHHNYRHFRLPIMKHFLVNILPSFSKSEPTPLPDEASPALHIPELVEMIFSNLSQGDLIQCSQTWRDRRQHPATQPVATMRLASPKIVRKMLAAYGFGAPGYQAPVPADICPILLEGASDFNHVFSNVDTATTWDTPTTWYVHPREKIICISLAHDLSKRLLDHGFQCKTASCRDMFVMIPTRTHLVVRCRFYSPTRGTRFWHMTARSREWDMTAKISNPDGVHIGDLLDCLRDMEELANLAKTLEWNIGTALAAIYLPRLVPFLLNMGPHKLRRVFKYVRKFPSSYYGAKAFPCGTIDGYVSTLRYGYDILTHGNPYAKWQKVWVYAAHYLSQLDSWGYYLFLIYALCRMMSIRYGRYKVRGQPGSMQVERAMEMIVTFVIMSVYYYFTGALENPLKGPWILGEEARTAFRRRYKAT
ncbi:hypothetical protein BU16DRAFT_536171 [Lophium mytilinum]|uniref:F-box domain-containing protein n=1 Tax=Lophium mytilinum TaxID=390894 RepID=A0A6A6R8W7_9PEZI|nr:hypothetical protein BU16DRAFT_536171 [Lophium mytilinum]